MDSDTEVERILKQKAKMRRPPSSYGSMKSDSEVEEDGDEERDSGEEEKIVDEEECAALPEFRIPEATGMQLIRSESPETLYTMTTMQQPQGAAVIDTRSDDLEDLEDDPEEDMDEILITNSPEPPEPIEPDDAMQSDENSQPGKLHPEQDLPHVFKSIQKSLTDLNMEELFKFKMYFLQWEKNLTKEQVMEGDILDFVDKIFEVLGRDRSLSLTITTLEMIGKAEESEALRKQCKRALVRYHLQEHLIRKHMVIHEGVVRAGQQNLLDTIYVEPQISTCGFGGVDPFHELRPQPPSTPHFPSEDTFVSLNNLFRLQRDGSKPPRTVVTTGIAGIGMSVCVAKFALDWAERRANKDLQFVIKMSFRTFWFLRSRNNPPSQKFSISDIIATRHTECKDLTYLEDKDCRFLIIMDSFDCYQAPLDWENAPVINDMKTQAHPDALIVNIIRGNLLPGAFIWILGRRAAVSQIPSQFVDLVTEIQGFSNEMKDDYLRRRFRNPALAAKIMAHYKRLPMLNMLTRQPFLCWIVATVFERCYRYQGYGTQPPRLTPFYVNILLVQTNRRLQFYYDVSENNLKWSDHDKTMLMKIGKMALKMLEKRIFEFFEEDVKETGLDFTEVTVWSGLCTELPAAASNGRRTFCFIHVTVQEFMAALYVFVMFRSESKNVLDSGMLPKISISSLKYPSKSAAGLVNSALGRTLNSPLGDYDMFLRFLCGLLSPECHGNQLSGYFFRHNMPKVGGLDEVRQLLENTIRSAPANRVENLRECLREMTQEDE